jgi:hypothetical protein
VSQVLGQHGLADAGLAAKEHVLAAVNEVEAEEALDESAIDLARVGPVEAVGCLELAEVGHAGTPREVGVLARATFERDQLLSDLGGAEPALVGMGKEGGERVAVGAKAQPGERVEEVARRFSLRRHGRSAPGRGG